MNWPRLNTLGWAVAICVAAPVLFGLGWFASYLGTR